MAEPSFPILKDILLSKLKTANTIAFVGLSKNAGKTSALNWVLAHSANLCNGVLTTGLDGEDIDQVYGNAKPKVILPTNTIYSTFSEEIAKQSANLSVLQKLPFKAGPKRLWLVQTLTPVETQIVGTASVKEQLQLTEIMKSFGADRVLIDGSLDRKSIVSSPLVDSVIAVASPLAGNIDQIIKGLQILHLMSAIPKTMELSSTELTNTICYRANATFHTEFQSLLGKEKDLLRLLTETCEWLYIPGAITNSVFDKIKSTLKEKVQKVILKHPTQLSVDLDKLSWLMQKIRLEVLNPLILTGFMVNSFSVSGNHVDCEKLRNCVRFAFPSMPVVDISEIE